MTKNEVGTKLSQACTQLYDNYHDLISMRANERTISSRIASLMEPLFSDYDVDSEHNRQGSQGATKRDLNGNPIIPDIIVHRRGSLKGPNLVAIEVKGFWNKEPRVEDEKKLLVIRAMFSYEFLYRIELDLDDFELIEVN